MSRSNERTLHAGAAAQPAWMRLSWPAALLSLACAVAGVALALHYPLSAALATLLFACVAVGTWWRPQAWPVLLPALLPIIGFATWTGWIVFEEFDLLVLAVAAGGYARRAWTGLAPDAPPGRRHWHRSSAAALIGLIVALFAASTLVAMFRGFSDAGGFSFGWFQGYREPLNSLRLAKPLFAALLLWPLWNAAQREDADGSAQRLSLGMMLGLLGASTAALWERLAFTDLLNFSADYRTTALFWEMHVGGAALDGYLALTMPFAVREMLTAPTKARWAFAAAVTALGTYACLTTFSRGVYLAVPVGLALMWALHTGQMRREARLRDTPRRSKSIVRLALIVAYMGAVAWMFPTSGYRGMLAVAGALVLLLPLVSTLREATRTEIVAGSCIGVVLALAAGGVGWLLPKGPYVLYALGALFTLSMLLLQRRPGPGGTRHHAAALACAGYVWVLTSMALVAQHWGGMAALEQALPVAVALAAAAIVGASVRREPWPADLRWQGNLLGAVVLSGGLVVAFMGGAYMGERFATTQGDLQSRLEHWRLSASMLRGTDEWLLGKGLGRYVDAYAISAPENLRPGDYRLQADEYGLHVNLTGGGTLTGDRAAPMVLGGDMVRLSQRVALPTGRPRARFDARTAAVADVGVGVCTKHLLYPAGCLGASVRLAARPGQWQRVEVDLRGDMLTRGAWYAPRLGVFVIGVDSNGPQVEVDHISLTDGDGRELLTNADFAEGLARWYFTSDRSHLPWHAKNIALHVLFDQGLFGLILLAALGTGALWRVSLGNARSHVLAPGLTGAVVGFAVVGLFDSLLDVPRVAFVWYSLLLAMLTLPAAAMRRSTGAA